MFTQDSPFLNIPHDVDPKQALFLDGMRHAVQIVDLSYKRLCQALTDLTVDQTLEKNNAKFAHIFLDAWAFVDAVDRFRNLWGLQPNAKNLPQKFSRTTLNIQLQNMRNIRNVSDHVAQRVDHIQSLNSSISGEIKWLTEISQAPSQIKSCFIRPGILRDSVSMKLSIDVESLFFTNGSGSVFVKAGKYEANLSLAYQFIRSIIESEEQKFILSRYNTITKDYLPTDMFGSAEIHANGGLKPGTFVCKFEKKSITQK
jgi:hypothetical protein